ncbi:related to Multidomain cyclophilin type peptidyl-prolyl cis-trans isomerase [Serendipita indica DSM 11827]|uniref:Peptidyl-prolyl cis-trans isomerase n=1 Tax=Serendipita indica (strain DSM 11827) TaxID=1109443 RepID=G4TK53_SERID|nr:related to Multidomain cyclophilin type peptidyl-prolyl cis-trans isomerase [Serendipita indica DSM 11827]
MASSSSFGSILSLTGRLVSKDFLAQTGDPTATGTGGECILSYIAAKSGASNDTPRYFAPDVVPRLKHKTKGTVSMAVAPAADGQVGGCGSQFFITLADNITYLDGKHAVFGHVVEGEEVLDKINDAFTDQNGRPFQDIRIRHVVILDDPYPDPPGLVIPDEPPSRPPDADSGAIRIADDEDALAELPEEEAERLRRKRAAEASALTLEMVGDLPFANVRPPENVLFVCKLNPVTTDEDLELIFSQHGKIMSCQIIRDKRTGDSLQYAFIEFDRRQDAEQAYFKMQSVLIDDRRIWVDFSQSVSRLNDGKWGNDVKMGPRKRQGGRGLGGRDDLEHTRRYRGEEQHRDDQYSVLFDDEDHYRSSKRQKRPERDSHYRPRSRSRSPNRDRSSEYGRRHHREDRESRRRSHSRERDHKSSYHRR